VELTLICSVHPLFTDKVCCTAPVVSVDHPPLQSEVYIYTSGSALLQCHVICYCVTLKTCENVMGALQGEYVKEKSSVRIN